LTPNLIMRLSPFKSKYYGSSHASSIELPQETG